VLLLVLAQDAVHYFFPLETKTVKGGDHIAQLSLDASAAQPQWSIGDTIWQNDQVVIKCADRFLRILGDAS